jgi:hypothetical protein
VSNVQRSGPAAKSCHASGIDTCAPGLALGENAEIEVLARLFRR